MHRLIGGGTQGIVRGDLGPGWQARRRQRRIDAYTAGINYRI